MSIRAIILGVVALVGSFIGATLVVNALWPRPVEPARPALAAMPPLQPLIGTSTVLAPVAVAVAAIRNALDAQTPRSLSGKAKKPRSKLLSNAELDLHR